MTEDRIQLDVRIDAPVERVWTVLTDPDHIVEWFAPFTVVDPAHLDLRPGNVMTLDLGGAGMYPTQLVTVDPPNVLSYRWAVGYPGVEPTGDNSTLVEFRLEPDGDGTSLRVTESGFASLYLAPDAVQHASYADHSNGWPGIVEKLVVCAEQLARR